MPNTFYKIKLSSDSKTLDNEEIENAINGEIIRFNMVRLQKNMKELNEKEIEWIKKNIPSARDSEKNFLRSLIDIIINPKDKKETISSHKFVKYADLLRRIDEGIEYIEVESEEVSLFLKAFEDAQIRPRWWLQCSNILNQLNMPKSE